jgi:L-ascorbate metabolism protein UlaG (beta-lactamase superfamily)
MKIKWLGHSAFLITSKSAVRIITDPYKPEEGLNYRNIDQAADIVTVSHEHLDHNNVNAVRGNPVVMKKSGETSGIAFKTVQVFHDNAG